MAAVSIPAKLVAGDAWAWVDPAAHASHPPPDWSLRYVLRPVGGGDAITLEAVDDGAAFALSYLATTTAAAPPGEYAWTALAFHDGTGVRETLGAGRLTVLPDPMADSGDQRSRAERILEAIDATLEGRATKDAESYTIEGRSISRTPIDMLLRLQAIYQQKVRRERNPNASPFDFRRVKI